MGYLNVKKFLDCFVCYRRDLGKTMWTKDEIHKFFFANLLSRRIQLKFQSAEMILEICERIQQKNFYYKSRDTKIIGLQFLEGTGKSEHSEPITRADIELLKSLNGKTDWSEADFENKGMSYPALSNWLGTLLPHQFIPVPSKQFRDAISFLFDLNPDGFPEDEFEFFVHSQKYFLIAKKRLKEFNLNSLYLNEIAEYVRFKYPKSAPKTAYSEYDWNWITQDFFLYIYREILNLDTVSNSVLSVDSDAPNLVTAIDGFEQQKAFDLYVP